MLTDAKIFQLFPLLRLLTWQTTAPALRSGKPGAATTPWGAAMAAWGRILGGRFSLTSQEGEGTLFYFEISRTQEERISGNSGATGARKPAENNLLKIAFSTVAARIAG